ncbi:MAG: sensor domain-containing diguanylate cyclase [Magnetococcus sp. DMHC-6]
MKLQAKSTFLILSFAGAMVLLLVFVSLLSFRHFSIITAQEHVRSAAEIVRVSLTESMINGTIANRQQFLIRLAEVQGLRMARVSRSNLVKAQFGDGLSQENSEDAIELQVMASGIPYFAMVEDSSKPIFRGTIPFIADNHGTPNCLECHKVNSGSVLGVITIELYLGKLKNEALFTILWMTGLILLISIIFTIIVRRQISPIVGTALGVQELVARAKDGDFGGHIEYNSPDEIGEIAKNLNRLMLHLQDNLGSVSRDVAKLMQYDLKGNTNLLTTTTEMVETLVEVSQFKQAIEEDQTKREVYARVGRMLSHQFNVIHYSIYEVDSNQNHLIPVLVDGEAENPCHWCDGRVLSMASACRAQRTGHVIDSVDTPYVCGQFNREGRQSGYEHICLPIVNSGMVGWVVQLVVEREHAHLAQLMLPFIMVYLRESSSVVETKRLMDSLRETALRDALTGLHNRRFLEEYVETLIATVKRKQSRLSILMMDLDHFKQVNDTYGHDAGDAVLKILSRTLSGQVRTSDLVIRYGGEEFLVILQENEGYSGMKMAEKIRSAVENVKFQIPGGVLRKTISVGVARFPSDHEDFWMVVKFADSALYQSKSEGRNRVTAHQSIEGVEEEE